MTTKDLLNKMIQQENIAKEFGFYWENIDQLLTQIKSECGEIKEADEKKDSRHLQEEIGDLLSAAVSLCIFLKFDPYETLQKSIDKFQLRYDLMVSLTRNDGYINLKDQPMEILMKYWDKAKLTLDQHST